MKKFITSDLHFYHKNIIKFCPETRGHFDDHDQMTVWMAEQWNSQVSSEDLTYILGDVSWANATKTAELLNTLNGKKILIVGNHDYRLVKDEKFRRCFEEIHHIHNTTVDGTRVVMCHFPMIYWDQSARGSVMLHGHLHQKPSGLEQYRIRNVGFDFTGKVVSLLDDIVNDAITSQVREM